MGQEQLRSGPGGSWTFGNCLEGQKGITYDLYSCLCQKNPLFCGLTSVLTCLSLLHAGCDLGEADILMLIL